MRLSTARTTTLLLTLAAATTSFVPELIDTTAPSLIMLDAPSAPNALDLADQRAESAEPVESASPATVHAPVPELSVTVPRPLPRTVPTPPVDVAPAPAVDVVPSTSAPAVEAVPPVLTATDAVAPSPPERARPPLVSTVGDSSMMFVNAALAEALGPHRWQPVPTEFAHWTDSTGGFDRHGCGPTGDSLRIFFSASVGPLEPHFNHRGDDAKTCDWRHWIPGGLELARPDVVVASWGPTTMWGWERDGQMVDLRDPVIRAAVEGAYREVRDAILAEGVDTVIWVAYPPVVWRPYFDTNSEEQPWSRPEVADELFALLTELGGPVVDLRDMADPANFYDGLHFTNSAADVVAARIIAALPAEG